MKAILDFVRRPADWILDWKSGSPLASRSVGLVSLVMIMALGCATENQIGFQPLGHHNRLADEMRAGDDQAAGRDLVKDQSQKSYTLRVTDARSETRGEQVTQTSFDWNAAATIVLVVAAVMVFVFLVFLTDRMMAYRHGLSVVQQAIEDHRSQQRPDEDLIGMIRPRVRAMGEHRKRIFDALLQKAARRT